MATSPVYTVRFFRGPAQLERAVLTVPGGKRWIIRNVSAWSTAPTGVYVAVDQYVALGLPVPAAAEVGAHAAWEGRLVAYAGERIDIWSNPEGCEVQVTGYEFTAA